MSNLVGCQLIPKTLFSDPKDNATEAVDEIVDQTCGVWVGIPYKRTDSNEVEVRANNAARQAYCGG